MSKVHEPHIDKKGRYKEYKMVKDPIMCHPDRPRKARGYCASCYESVLKEENSGYRDRQAANNKEWVERNPERIKRIRPTEAREKKRERYIRIIYGLTPERYNEILASQGGGCAICGGRNKNGNQLHVDHDHETNVIRGLLCFRCNYGLSWFSDNVVRFERAIKHLESNHGVVAPRVVMSKRRGSVEWGAKRKSKSENLTSENTIV